MKSSDRAFSVWMASARGTVCARVVRSQSLGAVSSTVEPKAPGFLGEHEVGVGHGGRIMGHGRGAGKHGEATGAGDLDASERRLLVLVLGLRLGEIDGQCPRERGRIERASNPGGASLHDEEGLRLGTATRHQRAASRAVRLVCVVVDQVCRAVRLVCVVVGLVRVVCVFPARARSS